MTPSKSTLLLQSSLYINKNKLTLQTHEKEKGHCSPLNLFLICQDTSSFSFCQITRFWEEGYNLFRFRRTSIMGNGCYSSNSSMIKLVFNDGTTRTVTGKRLAGEIMFEFPECMICDADSFFIGQPIPSLGINDKLKNGDTYFVLPLDSFTNKVLSASSLASLGNNNNNPNKRTQVNFKNPAFQYIKGSNGRVLIKVAPAFMIKLLQRGKEEEEDCASTSTSPNFLCSTPELKKHYEQLVGSKGQIWSPKLDTISEYKIRYSPCKLIGLEWREKE